MISTFSQHNFQAICDRLAGKDDALSEILHKYGYPPMWTRPAGFETLVLTILEQQVSLASAYAAYKKLKERIPGITPTKFLALSDEELRSCYFSRQKIIYTRGLAEAIETGKILLEDLNAATDDEVRGTLKKLKGIGDWTADIYLIHALQRIDIFPTGDLALIKAIRESKGTRDITIGEIVEMSEQWMPYRTVATMMFWHYYIRKRNIRLAA